MSFQLQIFKYQDNTDQTDNLTAIEIDGEAWFVANEVCKLLDIKNPSDAVSRLDEDEKGVSVLPTPSGDQEKLIISESGLYALIFKSKKEENKPPQSYTEEESGDMKIIRALPDGGFITAYERKKSEAFLADYERKLFYSLLEPFYNLI